MFGGVRKRLRAEDARLLEARSLHEPRTTPGTPSAIAVAVAPIPSKRSGVDIGGARHARVVSVETGHAHTGDACAGRAHPRPAHLRRRRQPGVDGGNQRRNESGVGDAGRPTSGPEHDQKGDDGDVLRARTGFRQTPQHRRT